MMKRFGLVVVALLIMPMVLTACASDSRDAAKDYMEAVLKGNVDEAQKLACESYQDQTAALAQVYGPLGITDIDLKYDIGKGNNQEEVIVTGAYTIGEGDDADEVELASSVREAGEEEARDTRIVLDLKKDGDDWCVESADLKDNMAVPAAEEAEPVATEEAAPAEATEEAEPAATAEATPEAE